MPTELSALEEAPNDEINLSRMLSVLASSHSAAMYDRHAAIFVRLGRYFKHLWSSNETESPALFVINGRNEIEMISQLVYEGFQRSVEGGGYQIVGPLLEFVSIICAIIEGRSSFETEESKGIQKFFTILSDLMSLAPEDLEESSSIIDDIASICRSVSRSILLNILSWLVPRNEIPPEKICPRKVAKKGSSLAAPCLLSVSQDYRVSTNEQKSTSSAYSSQLKFIENSNLIKVCVKLLRQKDQENCHLILQLLYHSLPSKKVRTALSQDRCATHLLCVISEGFDAGDNLPKYGDYERVIALEIIWTLINDESLASNIICELSDAKNLQRIKSVIRPSLHGYQNRRQHDKQMRNDVALILLEIISSSLILRVTGASQKLHYASYALWNPTVSQNQELFDENDGIKNQVEMADVAALANVPEFIVEILREDQNLHDIIGNPLQPWVSHAEDYFFIRILYQILTHLSKKAALLNQMLHKGLLAICFKNFAVEEKVNDSPNRWSQNQRLAIRQEVLGLLEVVLHHDPEVFLDIEGPLALCKFVNFSYSHRNCPGDSITPTENALLVASILRFLLFLVDKIPDHQGPLVNFGVMDLCLDVLKKPQTLDTACTAFLICSCLCRENRTNRRLFGKAGGVQTVIDYLSKISPNQDETEKIRLVCIEVIWTCIVGHSTNEALFIQLDGVYKILDILSKENSTKVQRHLLGSFLDLLENPKARSHALEWRYSGQTNDNNSAINLLVRLWENEEKKIECASDQQGFISINVHPLRGRKQNASHPTETIKNSQAVSELNENLRAKIFATLSKLGFENLDNYMSVEEQIKFKKIQKYLDFKIGAIWEEIENELEYEGTRPVSPDADCIRTAHQMTIKKAENVYNKQHEISKKKIDKEKEEERHFYAEFIDSHTSHPLQKLKEPMVARIQTISRKNLES